MKVGNYRRPSPPQEVQVLDLVPRPEQEEQFRFPDPEQAEQRCLPPEQEEQSLYPRPEQMEQLLLPFLPVP